MSTLPDPDEKLGSLVITGGEEEAPIDTEQGLTSLDKLKVMDELGISPEDLEKLQKNAFRAGKRNLAWRMSGALSPKQLAKKKRLRKLQKAARKKQRNKNRVKGMKQGKGSQPRGK